MQASTGNLCVSAGVVGTDQIDGFTHAQQRHGDAGRMGPAYERQLDSAAAIARVERWQSLWITGVCLVIDVRNALLGTRYEEDE